MLRVKAKILKQKLEMQLLALNNSFYFYFLACSVLFSHSCIFLYHSLSQIYTI